MRKSKKRKKQAQSELLFILILCLSGISYYYTKSLTLAISVFFILILIIIAYYFYKNNRIESRLRKSGIREIDKMDGLQFEKYLVALFKGLGYKAKGTPSTNDFGADLILEGKERIVVQAKRYRDKVGIKAVQEIVSAKEYYNANQAWVITNNFFTPAAEKLARSTNVKLIDRNGLQDMIIKINPSVTPKEIRQTVAPKTINCPKCGNPMIVKSGKYGEFFACSKYPICKNTRQIAK
ncbi:restriction endonuclease [Margalitia sp. FSL K6-0131]|uniref:restriction endonuclease n=1 Tax=Margalitia sp. FSL K6-0131 TaxID=2954604 RepID=UPI0030F5E5DF